MRNKKEKTVIELLREKAMDKKNTRCGNHISRRF